MSHSKGRKRERQAVDIYQAAGFGTQVFYGKKYGPQDAFGLFDFIALAPGRDPRFVQVKSNRAEGIEQWSYDAISLAGTEGVALDFCVCYDNEGWRLIQPSPDGHETVYDERGEGGNMGDALTSFLGGDDSG